MDSSKDDQQRKMVLRLTEVREALERNWKHEKELRQMFLRKNLDAQQRQGLVDAWDTTDRTIDELKKEARELGFKMRRMNVEAINHALDEVSGQTGEDTSTTT